MSSSDSGPNGEKTPLHRLRLRSLGAIAAGLPEAEPVVFLHGWGGSKEIWHRVLARCPADFYFVALDLPGTDGTADLALYTPETVTDWLLTAADKLGLTRFSLVGHSMGGNFSAQVALRAPERVRSLTLVNGALFSDRLADARHYIAPAYGNPLLYAAWLASGAIGMIDLLHPERGEGGVWRPLFRRSRYLKDHNSVAGMRAQLQALLDHPVDVSMLPPDLPVLLVHGALDATVPIAHAEEAAAERPRNTEFLPYADAHHCPMDEYPERFLHDLTAFLRGVANDSRQ